MANWNPFTKPKPKHWTTGVKESISALSSKVPTKVKIGLGAAGIFAGIVGGLAASIAVSPRLKPSDPKYKALREGGIITDTQHRKELARWRKKKHKTTHMDLGKYSYDITSYKHTRK